eukprot:3867085-Pleurochrysis_carterae.AAC.1
MATQVATPENVSTSTHNLRGQHTLIPLGGCLARGRGGAGWFGRHRVCRLSPARKGWGDNGSHHPVAQR